MIRAYDCSLKVNSKDKHSMNIGKNPQAAVIKKALAKDRWNLSSWARAHRYEKRTVYQTVERWAGRTDRHPHGDISRQIMADLRAQLGTDIVPEPIPSPTHSHRGES